MVFVLVFLIILYMFANFKSLATDTFGPTDDNAKTEKKSGAKTKFTKTERKFGAKTTFTKTEKKSGTTEFVQHTNRDST